MEDTLRTHRENAQEIGAAFAGEADRMAARLRELAARMVTEPALGDPASADFAAALNRRLTDGDGSYLGRARQYVEELRAVAGTGGRSPGTTGTAPGTGVGYHRYEGYPLEEKIAWAARDGGTRTLVAAQDALRALGRELVASETRLRAVVTRLGGRWLGTAGTTAVSAMVAATQLGAQLEAVKRARYAMPRAAPPRDGVDRADGRIAYLFDVQTDVDERVLRRRAAEDEADRQLYLLESASRVHLAAIPVPGGQP
ncbi:hypothetical protein [Actinophytocola sp. KF-1]